MASSTFSLDLPVWYGGPVVVGEHLGQQPVPKSQRRVLKTGKVVALHEFCKDAGPSHNDLCPARSDSGHLIAVLEVQLCQVLSKAHQGCA